MTAQPISPIGDNVKISPKHNAATDDLVTRLTNHSTTGREAADAITALRATVERQAREIAGMNDLHKKIVLDLVAMRERAEAERDSWEQQAKDRAADAARFIAERDALRQRLTP